MVFINSDSRNGPRGRGQSSGPTPQEIAELMQQLMQSANPFAGNSTEGSSGSAGGLSELIGSYNSTYPDLKKFFGVGESQGVLGPSSPIGSSSPEGFVSNPANDIQRMRKSGYGESAFPLTGSEAGDRAAQQPQETSVDDDLMSQILQSMMGGSGQTFDYESALADATQGIKAAYGSEIGVLQNQNRRTKREGNQNSAELQDMYEALAQDYARTGRREQRRTNKESNQLRRLGNESQDRIEGFNDNSTNRQADLYAALGQQESTPDALRAQNAGTQRDLGRSEQQTNRNVGLSRLMGRSQGNFLARGEDMSRLEGTNARADLMGQVSDVLAGNRDQIASLRGQQASDLANASSSLQSQQASMANDYEQSRIDNLMQFLGLRNTMNDMSHDNDLQDQQFGLDQWLAMQQGQEQQAGPGPEEWLPKNVTGYRGMMSLLPDDQEENYRTMVDQFLQGDQAMNPVTGEALPSTALINAFTQDYGKGVPPAILAMIQDALRAYGG